MGLQLCKFPAEVKGKQPSGVTDESAVTRIRTEVAAATTQSTNHYTITASYWDAASNASPSVVLV